jgi:autotransporter-associated beta strand protein
VNTNGYNITISQPLIHGAGTPDGGLSVSDTTVTPGSLTLTGVNTYTGQTTIHTGATLQLGNGATANSSGIIDDGTLVYNRFGAASSALGISGSGNVVKIGAGTQTLSASNGYTGATTIGAGILIVTGALNGTTSVAVDNGATLELAAANSVNSAAHVTLADWLPISRAGRGGENAAATRRALPRRRAT